jgi:hypothetical protein
MVLEMVVVVASVDVVVHVVHVVHVVPAALVVRVALVCTDTEIHPNLYYYQYNHTHQFYISWFVLGNSVRVAQVVAQVVHGKVYS